VSPLRCTPIRRLLIVLIHSLAYSQPLVVHNKRSCEVGSRKPGSTSVTVRA
jgi:hypothetical protein